MRKEIQVSKLSTVGRIDFVFLFDVTDGNPNGDPDAGNSPRTDPETYQGLVSDVALKRKVRDYVAAAKGDEPGYQIYVKLHSALHERRQPAWNGLDEKAKGKNKASNVEMARAWMCQNYYDVRTFGAVMSVTDFNCGQVRGPIQVTFARSIDPIADLEQTIVRKAVERQDAEKQLDKDGQITGTIGRKSIVPYALYRGYAFYNPHFAEDTGFSDDDLDLTIQAFKGMFDVDRSATRGQMSARRLIAFVHDSLLGNAPAAQLFERITVRNTIEGRPPRKFAEYEISIDGERLPEGVRIVELL
jgi:CRISPR-associated protein Csd2